MRSGPEAGSHLNDNGGGSGRLDASSCGYANDRERKRIAQIARSTAPTLTAPSCIICMYSVRRTMSKTEKLVNKKPTSMTSCHGGDRSRKRSTRHMYKGKAMTST